MSKNEKDQPALGVEIVAEKFISWVW